MICGGNTIGKLSQVTRGKRDTTTSTNLRLLVRDRSLRSRDGESGTLGDAGGGIGGRGGRGHGHQDRGDGDERELHCCVVDLRVVLEEVLGKGCLCQRGCRCEVISCV
jgi:hypothetical protein